MVEDAVNGKIDKSFRHSFSIPPKELAPLKNAIDGLAGAVLSLVVENSDDYSVANDDISISIYPENGSGFVGDHFDAGGQYLNSTLRRFFTLLVYVQCPDDGSGGTTFVNKFKNNCIPGTAIFFRNRFPNGDLEETSLHSGDVANGKKIVSQIWINKKRKRKRTV